MAEGSGSAPVLRARESLALLSQISRQLNTGLDPEALAICVRLCEAGVHPEALASAIQEIRREIKVISKESNFDNESISRTLM